MEASLAPSDQEKSNGVFTDHVVSGETLLEEKRLMRAVRTANLGQVASQNSIAGTSGLVQDTVAYFFTRKALIIILRADD